MSFKNLTSDELAEVAEFFVVDVEAAGEKPTKKELLAALSSGDEPVTWEQYNDIYLKAKASGMDKNAQVEKEKEETAKDAEEASKTKPAEPKDTSNYVLIKYDRQNPTFEVVGYSFTRRHPFASVPPETAEYLVRNIEGFRLALPSEVADYYN